MDYGHGHPGFPSRGLHAYAHDEFASAQDQREKTRPRLHAPPRGVLSSFSKWSLAHRRAILIIYLLTFASTFGLYRLVGRDWIPADDQAELMSSLTLPRHGARKDHADGAGNGPRAVEALPEVSFVEALTHGPTNHAHLFIGLVPRSERKRTHEQMAGIVRGFSAPYRNITYNVRLPSVLGGETYFPIAAIIRGPDMNRLAEISKDVASRMRNIRNSSTLTPASTSTLPNCRSNLTASAPPTSACA